MIVVDESKEVEFKFNGRKYIAYKRFYSDGTFDVEVNLVGDETNDVASEVQDEAERIMEVL